MTKPKEEKPKSKKSKYFPRWFQEIIFENLLTL
jgi:hypothetical protein